MSRNDGTPKAALPLMSFRPSVALQNLLNSQINYGVLPIENGIGQMNIDNYRVEITRMPTRGAAQTAAVLFRYLRKNLNQFMARHTCVFDPLPEDRALWFSDRPLGARLSIDLYEGPINIDGGTVICSDFAENYWVFSTIFSPEDMSHPVSGNREFGYVQSGDRATIYTMACDRVTPSPEAVFPAMQAKVFKGGHSCWIGMQQKIVAYVNMNGGQAHAPAASSMRVDWESWKRSYFRPTIPMRTTWQMARPPTLY